ncbi:MAG: hypothetical protein D6778_05115 [Nitrospirae bacterium]|nr:MAG: hypothetical protein D6778_05115 [Nitrospirota bacterium]
MVLVSGCGGKETRPIPPEVSIADRAIEDVYKIKEAFEEGDLGPVKSVLSEDIYKILKNQREKAKNVKLNFKTYWVEITPEKTTVFVEWDALWTEEEGTEIKGSGIGGFQMVGHPPKLVKILRDNPFLKPGI